MVYLGSLRLATLQYRYARYPILHVTQYGHLSHTLGLGARLMSIFLIFGYPCGVTKSVEYRAFTLVLEVDFVAEIRLGYSNYGFYFAE